MQDKSWVLDIGATPIDKNSTEFRVWAPYAESVAIRLIDQHKAMVPMQADDRGYFHATVEDIDSRDRYRYVLDGVKERPDPASRFQPEGVHGPSAVVDPRAFQWADEFWNGLPLKDFIIYELHVGTFTHQGTFEGAIPHLRYLKETVGVTAIELMPVAQFPGRRNWGYDGVHPFAVQASYGGPHGLKRLVDACHAAGLAVILDVVYNHLGPEGNYLGDFGPYFTDRYRTPWGSALNYDGPDSDPVRHYIISNALHWVTEYHIDALRLDAIHGIYDFSARHILEELALAVHQQAGRLNRQVFVIAESDLNDTRIIDPPPRGGYGLDTQWNDDFHHALRVALTGERAGYYEDFHGLKDLGTALREGFVYSGRHSAYRRRRHGNSSEHCRPSRFVVFSQNHDQIGNRAVGDRLSVQLPLEALKVARTVVLLSPNIPLLFMGEEYGERAPFQYFIDHGDPDLVEAVRRGRRREFARFGWKPEDIPDPKDPATFERCRLQLSGHDDRQTGLLRWTQALIQLRKSDPAFAAGDAETLHHSVWVLEREEILVMHRWSAKGDQAVLLLGFKSTPVACRLTAPVGRWQQRLYSGAEEFGGVGTGVLPRELLIQPQGTSVMLPGYTAAVYVLSEHPSPE